MYCSFMQVDEYYYSNSFHQLRNYSSNHSDVVFPMHKYTGCILPFTIIYGYWANSLEELFKYKTCSNYENSLH